MTARLTPGQTLQPTALVHEAYLRLVRDQDPGWEGRRHFFGAAAQAMREILIEQARHKGSLKHGGQARRVELAEGLAWIEPPTGDLLALDEAIQQLQAEDAHLAEIVQLRYYTGLERGGNGQCGRRIGQHPEARLARMRGPGWRGGWAKATPG